MRRHNRSRAACRIFSRPLGKLGLQPVAGSSVPLTSGELRTRSVPKSCLVDSGALVALLDPREAHHKWARDTRTCHPRPWLTCESVVSEALSLLGEPQAVALAQLLRRRHLQLAFTLADELGTVLDLRAKYANVPMSLADACLVRMSETLPEPIIITTDSDFRIYRRHSRQVVPCLLP